jgi:hypothetical protein
MQNNKEKPAFDFRDMPQAYFCENKKANELRGQLIRNETRVLESAQGNLEKTFFSQENMMLINKQLIYLVWKNTDGLYKISNQSDESLIIVMRYIFIEHSRHLPYDIPGQIKELNDRVINEVLPLIITNATQRVGYLKYIENPMQVLPLPKNTSNNTKDLPSVSSILFNR